MKKLALLVSVLTFFAFTGISMAATVDVTVGAPYIQKNVCDQVGNITLEWDNGTTFTVGDQIQIGLVGTPTFCKEVAMLIAVGQTATGDASGISNMTFTPTLNDGPLRVVNGDGATDTMTSTTSHGIAFQVQAAASGSTLLITVVDDNNIGSDGTFGTNGTSVVTFNGSDVTTELQLVLFDESTYADTATATEIGLYPLNVTTGEYTKSAVAAIDNTLCVNTGATFAGNYVGVGISSQNKIGQNLWDFNPASPNIAIIKAGQTAALYPCLKAAPGIIQICSDAAATQDSTGGNAALLIINENGVGTGIALTEGPQSDSAGYSDDTADAYKDITHRNNNLVFQTSDGTPFENATYSVELEIRVAPLGSTSSADAVAGTKGFYWNTVAVKTEGYASASSVDFGDVATSACAVDDGQVLVPQSGVTKAYDATGTELTSGITVDVLTGASACVFDAAASKAVKLVVPAQNITGFGINVLTDDFLLVDIPDISYDPGDVRPGDQVYVFAKLIKLPCELETEEAIHIGTVDDGTTNTGGGSYLVFPYFAEVAANGQTSSMWNGFTLTNMSTSATADGTAALTIYEADGDVFTATITGIAPGSVYANLVSLLSPTLSTQGTNGDGIFGGQRCWMSVGCDFLVAGTAQITNQNAGGVHSYVGLRTTSTMGVVGGYDN